MKETIFIYQIDDPKVIRSMQFIAVKLGANVKKITADMVGQKVGYITGLDGYTDEVSTSEFTLPTEEVMLLKGFSSQKIDQLLALFRAAEIPRVNLKAMLTDHNKDWYFYELYAEISKEHKEMSGQ